MDERITIKLFAGLGSAFPVDDSIDLVSPRSVREIVADLGIPEEKVTIIFINGKHASMADVVRPGEVLALFPPIGGG